MVLTDLNSKKGSSNNLGNLSDDKIHLDQHNYFHDN